MDNWFVTLPQPLKDSAYKTSNEFAWAQEDALAVVAILERNDYVIIGVDIWLPTTPGPSPMYVYDWAKPGCGFDRGISSATEFISTFKWDPEDVARAKDMPYFNLLAVKTEDVGRFPDFR